MAALSRAFSSGSASGSSDSAVPCENLHPLHFGAVGHGDRFGDFSRFLQQLIGYGFIKAILNRRGAR